MSTNYKQPHCLLPALKAYLVTFEVIEVCIKKHNFERFVGNVCHTCSKDLLHRTTNGLLFTNGRCKSEKAKGDLKSGKKCLDPNLKNEITRSILKINKRFICHFNR